MNIETIGIIGAGKLGTVLAQLSLRAGYTVYISGSGSADNIRLTIEALAPGAKAATNKEVAKYADVIILALPLSKFKNIPKDILKNKLVIDATNYWWEVDGPRNEILADDQSSSQAVQEHLSDSRVIKTLSHMGYHHLHDEAQPANLANRKAIAIAADRDDDIKAASDIVSNLGFDPVYIGPLSTGRLLEPGSPAFGANVNSETLRKLIIDSEDHQALS